MIQPRTYILVMCELKQNSPGIPSASHAHGSSRYWEHWAHPAPPVLSKKSTHALHSAADRFDEVLQPVVDGHNQPSQFGLVVPLHWLVGAAVVAGPEHVIGLAPP